MSTESIVVSLEWAKKLKEAGWPQDDALFGHFSVKPDREKDMMVMTMDEYNEFKHLRMEFFVAAAPTAEEILRRLPSAIRTVASLPSNDLSVYPYDDLNERYWFVKYSGMIELQGDTLANAAAAMYCYLAEQNILPMQHDNA